MTYNWYDQRASLWYQGYGPHGGGPSSANAGSFLDLSTLTEGTDDYNKALDGVTNNIIGLFEQKGITATQAQQSQQYQDLVNQAKAGDTKGAFQGAASAVTSAADRGDLWGADASEGGDEMRGRSFLEKIANLTDEELAETTHTPEEQIQKLYQFGFGREGKDEGLDHWKQSYEDGMSIQKMATLFAESDEAQVRDVYHEQYGRDAKLDGVLYWLENDEEESGESDADRLERVMEYRGEDLDGDGMIDKEERLTSKYVVQNETKIRDDLQNILGQVSNEENRANNPFFTAANNADVTRYMDHISAGGSDEIDQTTGERIAGRGERGDNFENALFTNTHIGYRGLTQDAINQGDIDDWDKDGAEPTGMGRFGTVAEIKEYMDDHSGVDSDDLQAAQDSEEFSREPEDTKDYAEEVFSSVMDTPWSVLENEKPKTLDDFNQPTDPLDGEKPETYIPWDPFKPDGEKITKQDVEDRLLPQNWSHWKGRMSKDIKPRSTTPLNWSTKVKTPDMPTPLPVDKNNLNYIPNVSSDVQDQSGYAKAKTDFDSSIQNVYARQAAQGQVGQRFTGTSAKGVKMKRSKASRMGTIRGTKQLGREQQTKSLNI